MLFSPGFVFSDRDLEVTKMTARKQQCHTCLLSAMRSDVTTIFAPLPVTTFRLFFRAGNFDKGKNVSTQLT